MFAMACAFVPARVTAGEVVCTVRAKRHAGAKSGIVQRSDRRLPQTLFSAVSARLSVLTGPARFPSPVRRFANTSTVRTMSQIASVAVSDVVKKLFPVYHRSTMP